MQKITIDRDDWCLTINGKTGHIEMAFPKRKSYDIKEVFFVLAGCAKIEGAVSDIIDKINELGKNKEKK